MRGADLGGSPVKAGLLHSRLCELRGGNREKQLPQPSRYGDGSSWKPDKQFRPLSMSRFEFFNTCPCCGMDAPWRKLVSKRTTLSANGFTSKAWGCRAFGNKLQLSPSA